ncbi:MAG: hypothetical protein Q9186_003949 [Xanthomendoza sp. 1 TL-2023]
MSSLRNQDVKYHTVWNLAYEAASNAVHEERRPRKPTMTHCGEPQRPSCRMDTVQWGMNWRTPIKMIALLIAGVLLATIHHVLYKFLDGRRAHAGNGRWDLKSQEWTIRYGNALAFLAKTCFAGSIAVAYQQQIWLDFRGNYYTLSGVSAMFAAIHDPSSFLHRKVWIRAKLGMTLALSIWLLPLSALVSPSALTGGSHTKATNGEQLVPAVDFMKNESFWMGDDTLRLTPVLERIAVSSGATGDFLAIDTPIPNSSYYMEFVGPSLRCEPPNATKISIPIGELSVYGKALGVETGYGAPTYMAVSPLEFSLVDPESSVQALWGAFVEGCVMGTRRCDIMQDMYYRDALWVWQRNGNIACSLYETNYRLRFQSTGTVQKIRVENSQLVRPVPDDALDSYVSIIQSLVNMLTGTLGPWTSSHVCDYTKSSSIWDKFTSSESKKNCTIISSFRTRIWATILIGAIDMEGETGLKMPLKFSPHNAHTVFSAEDKILTRNKTLGSLIEELSRNLTINLFSNRQFLNMTGYKTNVTTWSTYNIYRYASRNLFLSYGIAILTTLFGVAVGLRALWLNGVAHSTNFAAIVATTRDPLLATVTEGASMGVEPLPKKMLQTKLQFGVLGSADKQHGENEGQGMGDEVRRVGFGLAGQVTRLVKGGPI